MLRHYLYKPTLRLSLTMKKFKLTRSVRNRSLLAPSPTLPLDENYRVNQLLARMNFGRSHFVYQTLIKKSSIRVQQLQQFARILLEEAQSLLKKERMEFRQSNIHVECEKQFNRVSLELSRLQKKHQMFIEQIVRPGKDVAESDLQNPGLIIARLAQNESELREKLVVAEMHNEALKYRCQELQKQKYAAEIKADKLAVRIEQRNLEYTLRLSEQKVSRLRQISLMEHQQILSYRLKVEDIKNQLYMEERRKHSELKGAKGQSAKHLYRPVPYNPKYEQLVAQLPVFDIKYRLSKKTGKSSHVLSKDEEVTNLNFQYFSKPIPKTDLRVPVFSSGDPNRSFFEELTLPLPNPLVFIKDSKLIQEQLKSAEKGENVCLETMVRMRAILDAKSNQHMFKSDSTLFSRFGDFVFAWCRKYYVHCRTLQVLQEANDRTDSADFQQFVKQLHSERLNHVWEVITFREFLLEMASLDQLVFYLKLKTMLFKGDILSVEKHRFQPKIYTRLEFAIKFAEMVLEGFQIQAKNRAVRLLQVEAIEFFSNLFVDSFFLLRLLLEYYRLQRVQRYKLLKALFQRIQPQEPFITSFKHFDRIFQYLLMELTYLQRAKLFRDCYGHSGGKITPEAFFAVCTAKNYFVRDMIFFDDEKLSRFIVSPTSELYCFHPPNSFFYSLKKLYSYLSSKSMTDLFCKLGIVDVPIFQHKHLQSYEGILQGISFFQQVNVLMFKRLACQDLKVTQFIERLLMSNTVQMEENLRSAQVIQKIYLKLKKKIVERLERNYIAKSKGQTKLFKLNRISKEICKRVLQHKCDGIDELLRMLRY